MDHTARLLTAAACAASLALSFPLAARAAEPTAEWYGGTYGTSETQFPVSAAGSAAATSTQNGLTITKNNKGNTSSADYMMVATSGGWPMFVQGLSTKNISVAVAYTVASDTDGTIIGLSCYQNASEAQNDVRFTFNTISGNLKLGYRSSSGGGSYSRTDLGKAQPTDGQIHYAVMTYEGGSTGTSLYYDGVKLADDTGLKEGGTTLTEINLGAVRKPANIINGIKFHYVAVYNSKLSATDARSAYERAHAALNGSAIEVSRTIADGGDVAWSDAAWTIGGIADQTFTPASDKAYNVTVTVGGDCTIEMPASIGDFFSCNVSFALAENVDAATVTLKYSGTLPTDSATTLKLDALGAANVTAASGITFAPVFDGDTTGYLTSTSGTVFLAAKRPSAGVVSVRIGARTQAPSGGYIDPSYSNVGPYPVSGLFWNQTKFWSSNDVNGNYTDIQNLSDAKDGSSAIRIGYYGHNTYFSTGNGNPATAPNEVLTATYLDDSDSGNGNLTATASAGGETITLPTPGHNRGWQLHFENIPYNAYDVYFVTASDQPARNLKECPIYVSLDGGTTWKSYCGDSENEKTVMGTANWTGLPYAVDGALVHGKNYIKMRITKSIYGDNIGTIDITHGERNTGSYIRSGLAAIQIVEVENDGVYTLEESGDWSDSIWTAGSLAQQAWTDTVDGEPSIAKIASSDTVESVNVNQDVSAGSVILTGSDPFTVAGDSTLTVGTGFDASAFTGTLTLQAPIEGTIYIGASTDLQFGGDIDMVLPAYTLDGAGAWRKVGTGKLVANNDVLLAGMIDDGVFQIVANYSGNIALNGGDIVFAGPTGEDAAEIAYSGAATIAEDCAVTGKTVVASGTVQARGSIATDIDVESGAILKLGSVGGFGATDNGAYAATNNIIVVKSGGTVELNGQQGCNAYTLAGGTLQNTGTAMPTGKRQTMGLTLTADSTVVASNDFGMVNNQYAANTLDLGAYTLVKTGAASFWLYNTTVTGTGSIAIEDGVVYAYSTVTASEASFNIGPNGTLKIRTDNFSAAEIAGTGTLDIGTQRPGSAINFADGSAVNVKITLANYTETSVRIPYAGTPASVTVYEPDWNTPSAVSTVSYDNGYIVVDVDVRQPESRANPVTGASQVFTWTFTGAKDGNWATTNNWTGVANNRVISCTNANAPGMTGSDEWDPILLDGDLISYAADDDGYKNVSAATLEGWKLRVACLNGVKVTATTVKKHQGGCWYWVDETSKIVLGAKGNDYNGGNVNFYIAATEGVEFTSDFNFSECNVSYNLGTKGSVKFNAGATQGTQKVADVYVDFGTDKAGTPGYHCGRITRKLVAFGSGEYTYTALSLADMRIVATDGVTLPSDVGETELVGAATEEVGWYRVRTETDGIYLDYSAEAKFPHFSIILR